MSARAARCLAGALLLAAVASCGANRDGRQTAPLPPPEPRTTVRVENLGFPDVTVYVLRNTQRVRLGQVTGVSVAVLTIPEHVVLGASSLRFQVNPIGSRVQPISYEFFVHPGDEVLLVVR
jgi:hypothetical protein